MRLKGVDKTTFWGPFFLPVGDNSILYTTFPVSPFRNFLYTMPFHSQMSSCQATWGIQSENKTLKKFNGFKKNCISGQDLSSFDCLFIAPYRHGGSCSSLFFIEYFPSFSYSPRSNIVYNFLSLPSHLLLNGILVSKCHGNSGPRPLTIRVCNCINHVIFIHDQIDNKLVNGTLDARKKIISVRRFFEISKVAVQTLIRLFPSNLSRYWFKIPPRC